MMPSMARTSMVIQKHLVSIPVIASLDKIWTQKCCSRLVSEDQVKLKLPSLMKLDRPAPLQSPALERVHGKAYA